MQAAYDFATEGLMWDPERIVFFGRSIGTGPAVTLASQLKYLKPANPSNTPPL
jgi:acetyl esterase/lipase